MLCGSHLRECADRSPVHTIVLVDILAILIKIILCMSICKCLSLQTPIASLPLC